MSSWAPGDLAKQRQSNCPRVLLQTESGDWQYEACKKDDLMFSEVIPDLPVQVIPPLIVLKGSVAEIIETEWPAWVGLFEAMDGEPPMARTTDEARDTPYTYARVLLISQSDYAYEHWDQRIKVSYPSLSSLLRLSQLVNFPTDWELYVSVDRDVPQSVRLGHMQRVADILQESLPIDPTQARAWYFSARAWWTQDVVWRIDAILIHLFWLLLENRELSSLVLAHLRNLVLTTLSQDRELRVDDILWEDLVLLLPDEDRTAEMKNLIRVMQGVGEIEAVTTTFKHIDLASDVDLSTAFLVNLRHRMP